MKKIFPTILAALPLFSFAQEKPEEPSLFQAALIVGFNATQVDGDNFAGFHKVGLNAGGTVFVRFHDRVSTSFELLYSQKGSKGKVNVNNQRLETFELSLDYLEIPLLLNYHDKKVATFSLGISFNRLIRGKRIESVQGIPVELPIDYTTNKGTSCPDLCINDKNDFNIIGGVTFTFKEHYGLNLRYAYSLTSMGFSTTSKFPGGKMYNNIVSCRGMYIF